MQEFLIAFSIAFTTIFTAELGDKTQFLAFFLGTYFAKRKYLVIASIFTGLALVTFIAYLISLLFHHYLELRVLHIIAGTVFIILGLINLISVVYNKYKSNSSVASEENHNFRFGKHINRIKNVKNPVLFVVILSFLFLVMEIGDKSQFMVICLFLSYQPLGIFLGTMLAFLILDGMAILLAVSLYKVCTSKREIIEIIGSLLALIVGILMIVGIL